MIYSTEQRAIDAAAGFNTDPRSLGHPKARAVLTEHGWTVIASFAFGTIGTAR